MRPSRNRRWGHPVMIRLLERLSIDAKKAGWNGLMIGDIAQPRGGPMLTGHASHQIGLDADVWMRPMPDRRWSRREREKTSAISVLKKRSVYVDDRIWTKGHEGVLRTAASYPEVQRLFVHPGIKKKLCDTVKGDRTWLRKVRPYWGHHYHFHIRLHCPPGSTNCKRQKSTGWGTGCDKSLDWWFKVAFAPKKKTEKKVAKKKKKKKVRRFKTMADLPAACRTVLAGPEPASLAAVTLRPQTADAAIAARSSTDEIVEDSAGSGDAIATAITAAAAKTPAMTAADSVAGGSAGAYIAVPTPRPVTQ